MSDNVTSIIRTVVPVIVGTAISWLARKGIDVDGAAVAQAITVIIIGAYYAAVRWAENRWPRAGWLLGSAKAPTYTSPSGS